MNIPYQQMNCLIVNSYKPVYPLYFQTESFNFKLEEYIKSQLHLNVMPNLFQRDLRDYHRCLLYTRGDDRYFGDFCKVLRYFYTDIANMILKVNPEVEILDVTVDVTLSRETKLESKIINIHDIVNDTAFILKGEYERVKFKALSESLDTLSFKTISTLQPTPVVALALLLLHYSRSEELVLLEVR